MRLGLIRIQNYGSLKDVSFHGQPLTIFIGSNGQGKSLLVEALYRFFKDFNVIGGGSSLPVADTLWHKRETKSPIKFEITLELDNDELEEILPFDSEVLEFIKKKSIELFNKISIKRTLEISGNWKTEEILWVNIPLILDDTIVAQETLQKEMSSFIEKLIKKYKMYFFAEGMSQDNVAGDRLVIEEGTSIAYTSNAIFDDLVRNGLIQYSNEFVGQNWKEWAKTKGYQIKPPPSQLPEIQPISTEIIQRITTTMSKIREKIKLIPAARDNKSIPGHRGPLPDSTTIQNITSTSNSRIRQDEKKWEKYRSKIEKLLHKRLEPNPSEILIKEGDLGLNVAQCGGGEQCLIGLIWETQDTNTIYVIEEPENHLYPKKQEELFDYFKELSNYTQIILCTHSPVFASKSNICGVYLVSKDEDGNTQIFAIDESNVERIIDELGIRASYQFEYDYIAFVEGKDDVEIFSALAERVIKNSDILGFIDAEGWNNMNYYANAKVLTSKRVNVEISVIFDGDTEKVERNKKIKEKLVKQLNLDEDYIYTLSKNSIEDYLLNIRAIKRAFPTITLSTSEIRNIIKNNKNKKNKKKVLDYILKRGGIGKYNGKLGAQIIRAMTEREINGELKQIIKSIVGKEKPPEKSVTQNSPK